MTKTSAAKIEIKTSRGTGGLLVRFMAPGAGAGPGLVNA